MGGVPLILDEGSPSPSSFSVNSKSPSPTRKQVAEAFSSVLAGKSGSNTPQHSERSRSRQSRKPSTRYGEGGPVDVHKFSRFANKPMAAINEPAEEADQPSPRASPKPAKKKEEDFLDKFYGIFDHIPLLGSPKEDESLKSPVPMQLKPQKTVSEQVVVGTNTGEKAPGKVSGWVTERTPQVTPQQTPQFSPVKRTGPEITETREARETRGEHATLAPPVKPVSSKMDRLYSFGPFETGSSLPFKDPSTLTTASPVSANVNPQPLPQTSAKPLLAEPAHSEADEDEM